MVGKANLTLSTANVTKTYNGTLAALGTAAVTGGTLFGTDTVSGGTFAFTNANAGSGNKTVTASAETLSDGNGGGNYNITYANNTTSTITPASLTVDTSNVTKTYDGALSTLGTATVLTGTLYHNASNGNLLDNLSGGTFAFTDPNVGIGNKTVTTSGVTVNDGNSGGNYTVTYVNNTTSTINAAGLTITALGATKTLMARAYSGGNGVTYAGFVTGQSASSLGGTLAYGGTSQGARNAGSYLITPTGLTDIDYAISFVSGNLVVGRGEPHAIDRQCDQNLQRHARCPRHGRGHRGHTLRHRHGERRAPFAFRNANAGSGNIDGHGQRGDPERRQRRRQLQRHLCQQHQPAPSLRPA